MTEDWDEYVVSYTESAGLADWSRKRRNKEDEPKASDVSKRVPDYNGREHTRGFTGTLQKRAWKDYKSQRNKEFAERLCNLGKSEAPPIEVSPT